MAAGAGGAARLNHLQITEHERHQPWHMVLNLCHLHYQFAKLPCEFTVLNNEMYMWFYVFFSGRQTRQPFCSIWCASGKYIFSVIDHCNLLHLSDDNPHFLSGMYVLKTRWSQWGWKVFSSSHIRICLCSNGLRKNKICHQRAWWRRICVQTAWGRICHSVFKCFEEEFVIEWLDEEESVFKWVEEESVIKGFDTKSICAQLVLRKNLSSYGLMEHLWFVEESVIMWLDGESVFKWFQESVKNL